MKSKFGYNNGFSLAELAISFTVIALLVGITLSSASTSSDSSKYSRTYEKMIKITKALRLYMNLNGRLPCPTGFTTSFSDQNFGLEFTNGGMAGSSLACNTALLGSATATGNVYGGAVPVYTLGLSPEYMFDEWGKKISYIVDGQAVDMTDSTSPVDPNKVYETMPDTNFNITILDGTNASGGNTIVSNAVYALISHGKNGSVAADGRTGAFNKTGSANENRNCPSNMASNCNASFWDNVFVSQLFNPNTFDDIVIYKLKGEIK